MLEPATLDSRAYRRGLRVFDDNVPKSFNLDLSDLSRDVWSLLPQPGDFVAEVRTRRFDDITYARSSAEAEDVTLFSRGRKRNISAYTSEQKLMSRGRFFNEDDNVDYDVLDYDVDASFYPEREWMEGRTRLKLRVTSHALGVMTLRFADSLNVSSIDERRVRPVAVLARPQSEQRAGQPAATGGARFHDDAHHRLCRPSCRQSLQDESLGVSPEPAAQAISPTTSRRRRRNPSGCSAIATTGIRRTR